MKNFLYFILLIIFPITSYSQVGIGTESPNEKSILDIVSKDKGIFIPRMTVEQRDLINPTTEQNGLIVYNTSEDCLNYWSKTETKWSSVCGALGKAIIDSCYGYEVVGNYTEGVQLEITNYIILKIKVSKKGSYTILGTTSNGYSFSASGIVLEDDTTFNVQLMGQGTPAVATTSGNEDLVDIQINGESSSGCQPKVTINNSLANYSLSCKNSTVNGIYRINQALNSTSNYIDVAINVNSIGGWSISSDEVDGISFVGSGNITSLSPSQQMVRIFGRGTPTSVLPKTITLTAETASGKLSCKINVDIVIPSKTFLQIGTNVFAAAGLYGQASGSRTLLNSQYNFGTATNSTLKFEGFNYTVLTGPTEAAVLSALSQNPDIVLIGYSYSMTNNVADALATYLKNKGVVLIINEFSAENLLFDSLYGTSSSVSSSESPTTAYVYRLSSIDDPITNGPFGDVRSKLWGSDAGVTHYATGLNASNLIVYTYSNNGSGINFFRDPGYHLIYNAEGGFIAYSASGGAGNYPLAIDSNGVPATRTGWTGGDIENAKIFANMIAWAIETAEFDGINTK